LLYGGILLFLNTASIIESNTHRDKNITEQLESLNLTIKELKESGQLLMPAINA
jgi:hypothetical protein